VETVNLVISLQLFKGKLHLFLVLFLGADRFNRFQVHGGRFEVELGIRHKSEDSLILPVAGDGGGDVVSLRDLGNVVPFVAILISFGLITLGKTSVEKAVTLLKSSNENVLLFSITLDGDDSRAHATSRHFSNFCARLELHGLVELEMVTLLDEGLVSKFKGEVVPFILQNNKLKVKLFEAELIFSQAVNAISSDLKELGGLETSRCVLTPSSMVELLSSLD
jgi:hypothetical protein